MRHLALRELAEYNSIRCREWQGPNGIASWSLSDWAVEMAGETGEACNIVKKMNRIRDDVERSNEDSQELHRKLADELADVVISASLLALRAGINLDRAVVEKFNATSKKNGLTSVIPEG
ncbi:MazG-like family protein [Marivibrio halodurans]|uniref:MazG-like family protein n=1 Tax=Marivibrio halodurans TaxID=2039722 RepID=A0A8J7RW93_9PROT|nr:MazG-like family protein [Marivibrio halodurans]MBP5855695.1 MazG-like family protein [Marivibrio halodurans]